jgi:hypothetical protein
MLMRKIIINTTPQRFVVSVPNNFSLEEILKLNDLPPSLFQGYIEDQKKIVPIPLNIKIAYIDQKYKIIIQCIRNTDLRQIFPQKKQYYRIKNPLLTKKEIYFKNHKCYQKVIEINENIAKKSVFEIVNSFVNKNSIEKLIIAGVSGGGDSNTLVESLTKINNKKYIFFTLVFDPIWPSKAAKRAQELYSKTNSKHLILYPQKVEKILKFKNTLDSTYNIFCKYFGTDKSHFFATYLISLVARKLCKQYKTTEYCLGYNKEDVFAELLFTIINGKRPLSYPIRKFGKYTLLMPLYEIPKKILDACYPKYSIDNYQERMDTTTHQRSMIYYLSHCIEDIPGNINIDIMNGLANIFQNKWNNLKFQKHGELYFIENANTENKKKIDKFLEEIF